MLVRFELRDGLLRVYSKHWIFVISRNNLNGFRDFVYDGTNVGAGSCPRQDIHMGGGVGWGGAV